MQSLQIEPENDFGSTEYKLKLIDNSDEKIEHLATQMRFRMIQDNNSKCIYKFGVSDSGKILGIDRNDFEKTLEIFDRCLKINDYNKTQINAISLPKNKKENEEKFFYEYLVRPNFNNDIIDINTCILGNVDSGKSTFLSVLLSNIADDGRGTARQKIFRHVHEMHSGRSSTESTKILGIRSDGKITNHENSRYTWTEIVKKSYKVISFHDLPGHEKYFKTTIKSMLSLPDYSIILVNSLKGVKKMTFNHVSLCIELGVPFIFLLTKIDLAEPEMIKHSMKSIKSLLKLPNINKFCYVVKDESDVSVTCQNFYTSNLVPIFKISNKTLSGYDNLYKFFNLLDNNQDRNCDLLESNKISYRVESVFRIKGVGHVLGGILKSGSIKINDTFWLGPFEQKYISVSVKSIHVKRTNVKEIKITSTPIYVCLSLKCQTDINYRKGLVLLNKDEKIVSCLRFEAIISLSGTHSTNVKVGYKPIMCLESIRQAVKICELYDLDTNENISVLRQNQQAKAILEFEIRREHLNIGDIFVCSEGLIKLSGKITNIIE